MFSSTAASSPTTSFSLLGFNSDWPDNDRCSHHLFAFEVAIHRVLLTSSSRRLQPVRGKEMKFTACFSLALPVEFAIPTTPTSSSSLSVSYNFSQRHIFTFFRGKGVKFTVNFISHRFSIKGRVYPVILITGPT